MKTYQRQKWADHMRTLNFRQGEHIFVSAPTGAGKTTLIRPVLDRRTFVVCLFTKMKDATISSQFKGFKRFDRWPKHGFKVTESERKVMIWPYPEKTLQGTRNKHRAVLADAFNRVMQDGSWCCYVDELLYVTDPSHGGLGSEVGMMHYTGRSAGISMVTCAQRPFNVPRVVLSSASHAYFARTYDAGDRKRTVELGGVNPREIASNLDSLESRHDFLYLNPQGDAVSRVVNTRK